MKIKKILPIICMFSLLFAFTSNFVYANSESNTILLGEKHLKNENLRMKESVKKITGEPLYNGLYDDDGNIEIIDKKLIKKALLKEYNLSPQENQNCINSIDIIVNEMATQFESLKADQKNNRSLVNNIEVKGAPGGIPWYAKQSWVKEPEKVSDTHHLTYSTGWAVQNNYNSAQAIKVTYTKTKSISYTVGFEGSNLIKGFLSASASNTKSCSSSISKGAPIEAWTIWATRPYVTYHKEKWEGRRGAKYYHATLGWIEEVWTESGIYYTCVNPSDDYFSAHNDSGKPQTAPAPPTGPPDVEY